jgi:hypothetical protein
MTDIGMTIKNDVIINSIHQLETILFHDGILDQNESHPLIKLRDQLQQIDDKYDLITVNEKQSLILTLKHSELNLFRNFIIQYSSNISSSVLTALFDIIRLQIIIDVKTNVFESDHYFDFSLSWLTCDSSINYLIQKQQRIENKIDIDKYFLNLFCSIGSHSVYSKTNASYSMCFSHKKVPTFFQLTDSTDRLLRAFIIYLNNFFLNNDHQCENHISVLKWLLNLSDIYGFVPYFIKTGYPEAVLQWMTISPNKEQKIRIKSWFLVINLLYNLACHRMGVKSLNKLKAIDIIKQWKDRYISELFSIECDEYNKDILVSYYLVYSILLEPKQLKKESMYNIEKVLDYILERTVQAFDSKELHYGPYNVCEYLAGLAKFVVNDKFLVYVISRENIFELFIQKFLQFNQLCISNTDFESTDLNMIICSSLYAIFWSISFQSEYHHKLKSIDEFIRFVEQTSKTETNDEHAVMMKRAAKGILFNLDLIQMDIQPIEDHINDTNKKNIMISYAHKDITFCQKLVTALQDQIHDDIWVDFNKLSQPCEDNWEEIGRAITQCDVIIMIVTENYCSSKSCRREVIHADKRNKRMIPVYQGKDYKPEDWFEIRVASSTWVRFGDKKTDEEVMDILLKLINAKDKTKELNTEILIQQTSSSARIQPIIELTNSDAIVGSSTNNQLSLQAKVNPPEENIEPQSSLNNPKPNIVSISTSSSITTKPIEQWTGDEVQQWLGVPSSVLQLSSGRALLSYIALLGHENAQCDEYERQMRDRGISREQFANLISLFMNLRSVHNIDITSTVLPDQWSFEEVKCWFHQNHLSDYLLDTFAFLNGAELVTYAKLIVDSPTRIDSEYDRLKNQIQSQHNGKYFFHLNDYARLLNALKKLVARSQSAEEQPSCVIS